MFDPQAFMQTEVQGEQFDTERTPVEPGEYPVLIEECEAKTLGTDNIPALALRLKIVNTGDDNLDGKNLYHTIWLDLDERGALMSGANNNIGLGQLLAALDLNGKPWKATQIPGNVVLVQVRHRVDKKTQEVRDYVAQVAKAA